MHEGSIAQNIINEVKKISSENQIKKISEIKLICGKLHSVIPDSLKFFFDIMKKDEEIIKDAKIVIEEEDVITRCLDCNREFLSEVNFFKCPDCGSVRTEIIKGNHIFISSIKGE